MDNARRTVVMALIKQEQNGFSNLVLAHALERFEASPRDKAFVSAVFYGTVERLITLNWVLQKFLTKPIAKLDAPVRAILRSGLYQSLYLDSVPASAAINEAVKLTRAMGKSSAAGMVNAILRKAVSVEVDKEVFADETQRLCVQYSVSRPIAALLCKALQADCESFLQNSFQKPTLCVRVNIGKTTLEELENKFARLNFDTRRGEVPNSLYVNAKGDITATQEFQSGLFHVQGEASQFACAALAPKPGDKVLDLCAAPGGKSATLAQYMQNKGRLLCADSAQNRLSLMESLFKRNNVLCGEILQNDASVPNPVFENADAVLCDVPCSGLGLLAKKPDIRQKDLAELKTLLALQAKILLTASAYVKKGGTLVYSTCTVNPDENENIVKDFLANNPDFTSKTLDKVPKGAIICDNFVNFYPQNTQTDGFFVAKLERL